MHQWTTATDGMSSSGWPGLILNKLAEQSGADVIVVDRAGLRHHSAAELLRDVNSVIAYLGEAGLKARDRVGIRAPNCYEWIALDLALMVIGCVSVCVPLEDPQLGTEPAGSLLQRLQLAVLFQATRDSAKPPAEPGTVDLTTILQANRPKIEIRTGIDPAVFGTPRDVFTVVFSSGTTGRPKRLPISWPAIEIGIKALGREYELGPDDRILDIMPLSILQQRYLVYCAIWHGSKTILSSHEFFLTALELGKPTFILGSPSFYEIAEQRFNALPRWKRRLMIGLAACASVLPTGLQARWRAGIFKSLHNLYGGRTRSMLVGSAPVRPAMLRFFERAGFPLYQLYGMTEVGWITWNSPRANKLGTVGVPSYPGTVHLADDGEILVVRPWNQCRGYEDAEDRAAQLQVFPNEHTVATGDLGRFDHESFLVISGRKKNIIITHGGKKVSPEALEEQVAALPLVRKAVVFDHPADSCVAIAVWTDDTGPQARQSVARAIVKLNRGPLQFTPILAVAFPREALSTESGLLTRNLKVDRAAVRARVGNELLALNDAVRGREAKAR